MSEIGGQKWRQAIFSFFKRPIAFINQGNIMQGRKEGQGRKT